jgi:hypothetical protein
MANEGTELTSKLGKPALRALADAGYTHLEQFNGVTTKDLLALHGVGKKAIDVLSAELSEKGLSFA